MGQKAPKEQPTVGVAVIAKAEKAKRETINREEFAFAVWVGRGPKVAAWCKTQEEVTKFLTSVPPKKLTSVTIGTLKAGKLNVSVSF